MKQNEFNGYVVARKNLSDADLIINVFSKEQGRVSFVAKGVKKPRAKLRSHLEPLAETKFRTIGNSNLPTLVAADSKSSNDFFSVDNDTRLVALLVTEVIGIISVESQPNPPLYRAYKDFLKDCLKTERLLIELNYALITLLRAVGIEPHINFESPGNYVFDFNEGTTKKGLGSKESVRISQNTMKFWKAILNYDKKTIMRLRVEQGDILNSIGILIQYIRYHFGKNIKSYKVLKESSSLLQHR